MKFSTYIRTSLQLVATIVSLTMFGFVGIAQSETSLKYDPAKKAWVRVEGAVEVGKLKERNSSPIRREIVPYPSKYRSGTIVINTTERRLYRIINNNSAELYGIGVGREGFSWKGKERISRKAEWPSWTPPAEMRKREAKNGVVLPIRMEGGPNNPLGARALYLGSTLYRIHGTNQPWTIGEAVSSGCIRMANDDVIHLFDQVSVGGTVVVM